MKSYLLIPMVVLALASSLGGQEYGPGEGAAGKINVNTATRQELAWLLWRSGVGDSVNVADNIIEYREAHGPFRNIEELRKIKGINTFGYERIRLWVKVEGKTDYRLKEEERSAYPYPETPFPGNGASKGDFPDDRPYGPWRTRP